jgi:polar amino acid transport system substrate-binding protein
MRKQCQGFAFGVLLVVFSACTGTQSRGDGPPKAVVTTNTAKSVLATKINITPINRKKLPRVKNSEYWSKVRKGKLKVVIGRDLPPFAMKKGAKRSGFDVELAQLLGKTLGLEIEFIELPTDMILAAVSGLRPKGDIAIANITRTALRAVEVNFTQPYLTVSQAAVVDKRLISQERDRAEIQTNTFDSYSDLAKLRGIKIGVKAKTAPEAYAQSFFPNSRVVSFETLEKAFEALKAGKIQAVTHDDPAIRLWDRQNTKLRFRFATLLKASTEDAICMAIRKGDLEFLLWLNTFIQELQGNGALRALRNKYIVNMTWIKNS